MNVRRKLLLILVAASAAASLCVGLGAMRVLRSAVRERVLERMRAETVLLAAWSREAIPPADAQEFAAANSRRLGLRVTLLAADGRVLGDSSRDPGELPAMENHLGRPEIREAAERGAGESRRWSATTGAEYLYVAVRVDGAPVRFVRTALPTLRLVQAQAHDLSLILSFALAALLLLTALAYLVVRRLSRPIERMSAAVERVAGGDLAADVPYDTADEVGRLGASVQRMKRSLTDKIRELEDERHLLLSVLGGMKEGLLLVGPDHRIRLANDAFRQIFGLTLDPTGRLLAEVIRDPTVLRDLEAARTEGREVRDSVLEAADSGRSFELHATPLGTRGPGGPGGVLFLFFDITRLEALEGVRREFVADVSHELRTPLTSIQAFVETLLEGGLDDRSRSAEFLEIVRKHAGRMGALIDDLTDLSLIETGAVALDVEPVDVAELAREVVSHLSHRSAGTNVSVRVDLPSPFRVQADRLRLEQVLVNLVDNAIKFNRPGGTVTLTGHVEDGRSVVVVEDTGVGIPDDSLDRVFHRFHRVDKARSRDLGGTGLGLAIVKHLMRLHGGQVRVESDLGRGSRFFLEFPPS